MGITALARIALALLSLAVLAAGGILLWQGLEGEWAHDVDGVLRHVRDDTKLWIGAGLLAWSVLGRFVLVPLLAKRDDDPLPVARGNGSRVEDGASLYVETHGVQDAPPILFTHGWGLDSTVWGYAKRDLGSRFKLILWDLPGLGKSRRAHAKLGLPEFAEHLRTLLAETGRPAVLVGHSIGGMTIQTLARGHPELFGREVAGVVLLNTTYTNPLKTMIMPRLLQALRWPVLEPMMRLSILLSPLAWLSQWQSYLSGSTHIACRLGFGRYVTRSQLSHTALLMTRNSPAVQSRGDLAMFRWDSGMPFRDLDVPLLVVGGGVDIITKEEAGQRIAGEARTARYERIEGVNHMGFLERADVYNRLIGEFAASVQPATMAAQGGAATAATPQP
ncbi:alpha/beta fold hydrolase [Sphingomonas sp. S2-65]|uniref:alpha/beta fold hydrolase n=1 Tax=Sphingomonas sp. S2-65 TaxID=2903960 RepID=UPI001F1A30F2|nr:alpha/beta hydrolase [Sphingomonas sp. S2-65]UYY60155.1 alpha/beta hydrolase [Sphingomonas sp. S2-65]